MKRNILVKYISVCHIILIYNAGFVGFFFLQFSLFVWDGFFICNMFGFTGLYFLLSDLLSFLYMLIVNKILQYSVVSFSYIYLVL